MLETEPPTDNAGHGEQGQLPPGFDTHDIRYWFGVCRELDLIGQHPDRNLAMELVRATESACLAAARWVGRGDKNSADNAAVESMRLSLSTVAMDGIVVIGEGEKDEAPMLYNGEQVGDGSTPEVDVAVDPIDGTTLTAQGRTNALSVIAVADRGSMLDPGPSFYMNKIAVGPEAVGAIDITASPTQNLRWIAKSKQAEVEDLVDGGGSVEAGVGGGSQDLGLDPQPPSLCWCVRLDDQELHRAVITGGREALSGGDAKARFLGVVQNASECRY